MKKKKIVIHSNHSKAFTGFGKHTKNLLQYLYSLDKYEIIEFANGLAWDAKETKFLPWKCYGSLPSDPARIHQLNKDPNLARAAGYGAEMIDELIKKEKPDIYVGIEDIWGFSGFWNKSWWNKINCMVWTTLDSLPLLPEAVSAAPKIKNYHVWASFAKKELNRLGHEHVGLLRGSLNQDNFFKLTEQDRDLLRQKQNIKDDEFIIGFVFRNQLRKSVPNLLDGFKLFQTNNPQSKAKLLLHTYWNEGWDILKLLKEKEIDEKNVLTTYVCRNCNSYNVRSFSGHVMHCDSCRTQNSCETANVKVGVSEEQLNEIYNLMDVYCHPFTSGGQEIPIQEAKLTELITLVTDYSCGEEMCNPAANSLSLNWSEYREFGTQFIKATTDPKHIAKRLEEVYKFSDHKKDKMGKAARQWALQNFSVETVGKKIENFLDSCKVIDKNNYPKTEKMDPHAKIPVCKNATEWLKLLYKNILKTKVTSKDEGLIHWLSKLAEGMPQQQVEQYFRDVASSDNSKSAKKSLINQVSSHKKRILYCMPESELDLFISTSLFSSIKELYPDHDLYVACQTPLKPLLFGDDNVHKVLDWSDEFNTILNVKDFEGDDLFEVIYTPSLNKNNFKQICKTNN